MAHRNNKISDMVDGLYVKNGRLINGRPPGMSGIEQAANLKRIIDKDRKIEMIADGIERSENRKGMMDYFGQLLVYYLKENKLLQGSFFFDISEIKSTRFVLKMYIITKNTWKYFNF